MTPPTAPAAVGYGVVGTAGGALVLLLAGVPPVEAGLLALVIPALMALGFAVVQQASRAGWLRASAGMLLGSLLCLVVVVGLLSGVGYLLSDPG